MSARKKTRTQTKLDRILSDYAKIQNEAEDLYRALTLLLEVWPNKGKKPGWCERWVRAQANARVVLSRYTPKVSP